MPGADQAHGLPAARTEWRATALGFRGVGQFQLRIVGRLPRLLFCGSEPGVLTEQGAHAVGAEFGGWMQPAEGADAGKVAGQDVLEKAAHELEGLEFDRGGLAGFALAIVPTDSAIGHPLNDAIGGGGFEDVAGEITQGIFTRASGLAADVPMTLPDLGRDPGEELGLFLEQAGFEEGAAAIAQRLMVEEERFACRDPGASVQAETPARHQVMDVGMKDEGATPGVEDTQHAQLGSQPAGIGGQILQRLGAGGKEQVQGDLLMRADEAPQFLGHGEGDQEVRDGQEQARPLALKPVVGVGLTALRTVPVVTRMIAVEKARAGWTLEELATQGRGAAGEDLLQDPPMPRRHGGTKTLPVIRS